MKTLIKYPVIRNAVAGLSLIFALMLPVALTGKTAKAIRSSGLTKAQKVLLEADSVYTQLHLQSRGLTKVAFVYAWKGYRNLAEKGLIRRPEILSICDFSQSSCKKRFYIIDLRSGELVLNTFVAHGRNSGGEYARKFSNRPESHQSSLGFYVTRQTYYGEHGLSLNIDGLEKGINDKAEKRRIVIHGSDYIGPDFLRYNKFNGRSYGCPAVPLSERDEVINTIKDGSCLFIYHPTKLYLSRSKVLNM